MDRSQITGLIVMLVLLTVYFQFFSPEVPPPPAATEAVDSIIVDQPIENLDSQVQAYTAPDSIQDEERLSKFGAFANSAAGKARDITFENEDLIVTFSTLGGVPREVRLKKHFTDQGEPITLMDAESSRINLLFTSQNKVIATNELYFNTTSSGRVLSGNDSITVEFSATASNGGRLVQQYTLYGSGYQLGYNIDLKGLESVVDNQNFNFIWDSKIRKLEPDLQDARNRSTVKYYSLLEDDIDYLTETSTETEQEILNEPLKWVSIKQKFFTSAIVANTQFTQGSVQTSIPVSDEIVKNANMSLAIAYADLIDDGAGFRLFFGPNDYNTLNEVAVGFWKNVPLGWGIFGLVNKYMIIPIFNFLDNYFDNYGLIILLMVIIIRILLAPLTFKSHISMAKMKVLKPDLDLIKEKHGGDMQKAQAEQMQLYQKVGINPLSGCIPMVLQMPILLAMFYFFPNAVELRQQSFLWAHDLSTYDSILNLPFTIPFYGDHVSLFTLLMTASTILYTWSNSQVQSVTGPMKSVQYVMPIMFLFFLNNYASGLTYYYFLTNIASFGQIALFRKFIDDDKIKQKLEENRKKNANKKKSSFQARIEEAMKASQQQKQKAKKSKK